LGTSDLLISSWNRFNGNTGMSQIGGAGPVTLIDCPL